MIAAWKTIQDATAASYSLFEASASDLQAVQQQLLMNILKRNRSCEYGSQYRFSQIQTIDQYQKQVPIVQYEDIEKQIEQQTQGHSTLCADPVLFYEETSGSSARRKLIPYTHPSLDALQQAVNPWLFDLTRSYPKVTGGTSYWSISPVGRAPTSAPDGTPVGAPSDLAFLAESLQAAFVELLATPPEVALIQDIQEWRYHTLFALIANANLALISVWSPGFLTLLIESIPGITARLLQDLKAPDEQCSLEAGFWQALKHRCDKADMLGRLIAATNNGTVDTLKLWPKLHLISCWTHGAAAQAMPALKQFFPVQAIQPKGLLATEAVISISLAASDYPVLAARSAFFEFLDDDGRVWLAHELKPESSYGVVVTTFGGLYRYAMGDVVRVRGHYRQLPALEFTGRSGVTSDLSGEKLSDAFVANCLRQLDGFSMLAPRHTSTSKVGYCLYVDAQVITEPVAEFACQKVEQLLQANPHYQYARKLGQLQPLRLIRIATPEARYVEYCTNRGQTLGDIKPVALCIDEDLVDYLVLGSLHENSAIST